MPEYLKTLPWAWIARAVLALAQVVPGLILTFDQSDWVNAGALGAWSAVVPVWVFGLAMVVGGIMVLINKVQNVGCVVGAGAWTLLGLGYVATLLWGTAISPLGLGAYPLAVLAFVIGSRSAFHARIKRGD